MALLPKLAKAGIPEDRVEALRKAGVASLAALRDLPEERLKQLAGPSTDALRALRDRWSRQRAVRARLHKKFVRYHSNGRKNLSPAWRKPRGIHNKVRQSRKGKPAKVRSGYGFRDDLRHVHPSGFLEVLVHRPEELAGLGPDRAVRVGGRVGRKKRLEIQSKAREMGLRVLNPVREG
jgi:large subunit ribosomal protein L32e